MLAPPGRPQRSACSSSTTNSSSTSSSTSWGGCCRAARLSRCPATCCQARSGACRQQQQPTWHGSALAVAACLPSSPTPSQGPGLLHPTPWAAGATTAPWRCRGGMTPSLPTQQAAGAWRVAGCPACCTRAWRQQARAWQGTWARRAASSASSPARLWATAAVGLGRGTAWCCLGRAAWVPTTSRGT